MCLTRTRSNARILRCSGHRRLTGKPWADVYDSSRGAATPSRGKRILEIFPSEIDRSSLIATLPVNIKSLSDLGALLIGKYFY